mmetsp:Transcript_4517/g.6597  ORF Transcript_4517/g.6597 Transcript_4517/m.6597 type:complete len:107 (-) Transcript_4517:271-591(-)
MSWYAPWGQHCTISPSQARATGSDSHSSSRNYFFDNNTISDVRVLVNRVQYTTNDTTMGSIFYFFVSVPSGRILFDLHLQPIGDKLGLFYDQSVESVYSCSFDIMD